MNRPLSSLEAFVSDLTAQVLTVSLAFDDPRIKPYVSVSLVQRLLQARKQVIYIDFDLQFSSYLQNFESTRIDEKLKARDLIVFQPTDDAAGFVRAIAALEMRDGGVLILDSLNSLQNLLNIEADEGSKEANQKTALLVTVLQIICRHYAKSLVILNLTRSRPTSFDEKNTSWEKTLVGGRMIRLKSDSIFFLRLHETQVQIIQAASQGRSEKADLSQEEKKYQFKIGTT